MAGNLEADDPELDALLDSALEDFRTTAPASAVDPHAITSDKKKSDETHTVKAKQPSSGANGTQKSSSQPAGKPSPGRHGDDDAVEDKELDEALDMLMADDPYMKEQFGKFMEAAAKTDGSDAVSQRELAAALAETLGSLARNAESLKADSDGDGNDEDLMKAFAESMNLEGSGDMPAGVMPMMQSMMKNILSKDVLYPSLKDLADKFPPWLAKNKEKLSKKSYDSHARQFDFVVKIIDLYEAETDGDSEAVKSQRFENVLSLMTQLQDCGALPKEIVGEMAPGLEFDDQGVPKLPGMAQCPIM